MTRTIIVTGYFDGDPADPKVSYFDRLNRALGPRGLRLHLLNLNGQRVNSECSWSCIPKLIERAHRVPAYRLLGAVEVEPAIRHAASLDALCWGRSLAAETFRVLLFREYVRRLIDRMEPCLIISWHEFFSLHYSLPEMLRAEYPWTRFLFTEFGPLPGTIVFDADGQMGESWIARDPERFLRLDAGPGDIEHAKSFVARVRAEKRSRKPQAPGEDSLRALERALAGSKPVIFFAGQYDCRTGLQPTTLPNRAMHSTLFGGTLEALSFLGEVAEERDWTILFKPHPLADHSEAELRAMHRPGRVVIVRDASIFECFDRSDAVVTIVSQVSYMALIHDKPCVLLGRTYLTGKGCVYEPRDREHVGDAIASAISDGFASAQREAWHRHVAQLLRHAVFGFDADLAADGVRSVEDAAAWMAELCRDVQPAPSTGGGMAADLLGDASKARLLNALYAVMGRV